MSRKAMYEKPSQRKSEADAFSAERFVKLPRNTLAWSERAGDLRITRMAINNMITNENTH